MVIHAAASINAEKQQINDLNVFPVPDGDTGTNMSLTIGAAATELKKNQYATVGLGRQGGRFRAAAGRPGQLGRHPVPAVPRLCQGASRRCETIDGRDLAIALDFGVAAAYKAVMKPAEGTILTVSRMAAARAAGAAREDNCLESVLQAAIEEGQIALDNTINQNPVLKKAGVVDAGGKGFLVILQGMLDEIRGVPMPQSEQEEESAPADKADFAAMAAEDITFAFDTVFIVRKHTENVDLDPFRKLPQQHRRQPGHRRGRRGLQGPCPYQYPR